MRPKDPPLGTSMKLIAKNKKAYFDYEIIDTLEAGISLLGSEVKSVKLGRISLKESYVEIKEGEAFLVNCNISPYEAANIFNHEPRRERKLLLHRRELKRWMGKIREKGLTIVPTKVQVNKKGLIKLEIALVKGKRAYQKREAIRERDRNREMQRELKDWKR